MIHAKANNSSLINRHCYHLAPIEVCNFRTEHLFCLNQVYKMSYWSDQLIKVLEKELIELQ